MANIQASNGSAKPRANSISQASESSQTAAEFINSQLQLEAEAREALPYQFDTCTRPLGALRQNLFSCLTCNPPPASPSDPYTPAGICYSCSISCHGEHTLVELFSKRNFVCDCGTTRFSETSPCTLRVNEETGEKGRVTGEEPCKDNKYNQNFRNQFCGCGEQYDPHQEKGTMFQCLGLGTVEDGGCGEDWWHPECVIGLNKEEYREAYERAKAEKEAKAEKVNRTESKIPNGITREVSFTSSEEPINEHDHEDTRRPSVTTAITGGVNRNNIVANGEDHEDEDDDPPLPPGFPQEDDFEHFLCYKCVDAFGWIKRFAGTPGFLPPVYHKSPLNISKSEEPLTSPPTLDSKKRKASDEPNSLSLPLGPPKRQKSEDPAPKPATLTNIVEGNVDGSGKQKDPRICKLNMLGPASFGPEPFSLFMKEDFRDYLCHCVNHYMLLRPHKQLLEEEDVYEPPVSVSDDENGALSVGTGSLLDRGEAAFSNMDRVRAIEGAMVYAHLKDKVKAFLQPFAESGQVVGAEDIKAYFEKLRGDEAGIRAAAGDAQNKENEDGSGDGKGEGGGRREQSGY
ncbi:hypothetical protein GQ43DRAFT_417229 [Delitschia confertaspora ATCC 74209]|uniref:UBR-type domain-containing protein n=1 Tax=Delitschia confertaspora ATCC 74209 TaxID=1513339 RepID=A0A9P4JJX7_9PLEO|nr:hypothetical protein GQ43DRAFT_417229 [Delitschia confertaspora ATCC 74209]